MGCIGRPVSVVRTLLANGADVNAVDTDGYTALMFAAGEGRISFVNALLA